MPLRRSKEEIEKFWIGKAIAPEVAKRRLEDVREVAEKRMKRVVRLMSPVNDEIRDILDRHGIAGMRRMDYFNFGRQVWRVFYERSGEIAERYFKAVWDYHKTTVDLNEDIMTEIVEVIRPHAERARAEDLARLEAERKALLAQGTSVISGGGDVGQKAGDSSSSKADGATGEG